MLNTWEDELHDKMTSAFSKSCGYKKFSVHINTKKYRFQIVPLWRAFSKSSVFVDLFMRISVDGSCIHNNKVAFSNLSGRVWTGPSRLVKLKLILGQNFKKFSFSLFVLSGFAKISKYLQLYTYTYKARKFEEATGFLDRTQ